jgi:hypothetical protein
MTIVRVALVAACAAVLLGRPGVAEDSAETAVEQGVVSPVPATMPLPPPLPPAKTTVAAVNG